jgi:hypothetical protein
MKTTVISLAALAACASIAFAERSYTPREFLALVSQASGGPEGIRVDESRSGHEAQLAALQALVVDAPNQDGLDAANANICILLALLGRNDEASQVAEMIRNTPTREKRKLHIIHITKGEDAAVSRLRELLGSPDIPKHDHAVYVEKAVNVLGNNAIKNQEVAALALSALDETNFKDSNAEVGLKLVKFLHRAAESSAVEPDRLRAALEKVENSTPQTKKTTSMLDAVRDALSTLPAP